MGAGPKITCLTCGYTIQSMSHHNMEWCGCNDERYAIAVDGGDIYLKFTQGDLSSYMYAEQEYADWPDENPPRVSKGSLPNMGVDGKSVKLLAGLKGVPKK